MAITYITGKHSGEDVSDYVSSSNPLPVNIIGSSIDVSLSGESTYIDTRKGEWVDLCPDSGNDTITPLDSTMPSYYISMDASVNGYACKAVFSTSGQSITAYPMVADKNGDSPAYLPTITFSSQYVNDSGLYESQVEPIDVYGFSQLAVLKSGLTSGTVQIKGVPY